MTAENIPDELQALRQWVCWRDDKVPCQLDGKPASTTNPATWNGFAACLEAVGTHKIAGIGFVFTDSDPYSGIDLDKCFDGTKLTPKARELVDTMDSYTELSPSGKGLHIIVEARVGGGRRSGGIELYDIGRYFTFTGNIFENREAINDPTEEVVALWRSLGGSLAITHFEPVEVDLNSNPPAELLTALLENDHKFKKTWEHRRQDFKDQSLSTYDMALTSIAIRTGWTDQQVGALLASHRRKWGDVEKLARGDYVGRTIARARAGMLQGMDDASLVEDKLGAAIQQGAPEALIELSIILGVQVDGFIRRGMEPGRLYAKVGKREFLWGTVGDLMSLHTAEKAWMDQTQELIQPMKGPAWKLKLKYIVDISTYEPDESSSRVGLMLEEIAAYIDDQTQHRPLVIFEDHPEDAALCLSEHSPFLKEGKIHFHLLDFNSWIGTRGLSRGLGRRELKIRLQEAGCLSLSQFRIGKMRSRGYYAGIVPDID